MAVLTLQRSIDALLSGANKEQNMHYPPRIFSSHFNTVSDFLIDECVRVYPKTNSVKDILRPLLKTEVINVSGGRFKLPADYRNVLRIGVNVDSKYQGGCGCHDDFEALPNDPLAPTRDQLLKQLLDSGRCLYNPVEIVEVHEWDKKTRHSYKMPTHRDPIANQFDADSVRVCPFDIPNVELTYVRKPKEYNYGYTMNPDDTYTLDPITTVESEWDTTALQYIIKGLNTLYSMYVKDGEMRDWNLEIKKIGLF